MSDIISPASDRISGISDEIMGDSTCDGAEERSEGLSEEDRSPSFTSQEANERSVPASSAVTAGNFKCFTV